MKFFNKIVYFLITIGSNSERRKSRIDYGNMGMIVFYFIQLIGYVYSQFETKQVKFYENDYLAQIGQYSSLPFIMITIHYDPFTLIMFIGIFGVIVSIYVAVILQIYYKHLEPTHAINRFIKYYFQNFQWYFLTPFHECMVGVKTCGSLAYFAMNSTLDPGNCWSQISLWFVIPSIIGQVLLICSGFLSLYCFRNYEFIQGDLMRKFSILNLMTVGLHMVLQMCCFWKDEYSNSDLVKHIVLIQIMVIVSADTYINLPFGFTNETIFFSQVLGCSFFFVILVCIWIFSSLNDGIIFLTFTMFLIFSLIRAYFERYYDRECLKFCQSKLSLNSDYVLEYLCQLTNQETAQQDCIMILKYMWIHCQKCKDIVCPCKQKISKFTSGQHTLNTTLMFLWVQYQFQQALRLILEQSDNYQEFEGIAIKFVTFLQRYRENKILSQKIIQDILIIYQKFSSHSYPYFFLNLTKRIQYKNKIDMEQHNRSTIQIPTIQYKTMQDLSLFYVYEQDIVHSLVMVLQSQKTLWISKMNAAFNLERLLKLSQDIMQCTIKVKKNFDKFQSLRERPLIDSILILRLKFLISLICMEDFNQTVRLALQINQDQIEQSNIRIFAFNNCQFLNGTAISVISKVSTQTYGQINSNINDQICNFFSFDADSKFLTTIEQLLPCKIGQIHNGLIEYFLQLGKSDRLFSNSEQFIVNSDQIIEKVLVCLSAIFPYKNQEYQFLIIGHLLKTSKYQRDQLDQNRKGYILVDSDFTIFGLTKNILDRLNYKKYQKNVDKNDLMTAQKVYTGYNIFQLIPQIQQKFEQYYKLQTLQNQKRVAKFDTICSKESGMLVIPKTKPEYNYSNSLQTHKYTNKHMINVLKDFSKDSINYEQSVKQFPIEFNLVQKVLTPIVNDSIKEFLYFIVEVEFQEENQTSQRPSNYQAQTPALFEILRKQTAQLNQEKPNQSNVIMSNDENDNNEQIDLIVDMSQTGSRKSQGDLMSQISKIRIQMSDSAIPHTLRTLIVHFFFSIILFLVVIIVISILFARKKSIQSDCIQQISQDLDFLDAYSETMAGSRHVIFYRDFYEIVPDTLINLNNSIFNVSKHDKIYMAWQQIQEGNIRMMGMYESYLQTVQKSSIENINFYIINYDLKSKITQTLETYSAYYQIIQQIFHIAYNTFASTPDVYLSGQNDSYLTQIARSMLYYNFFDAAVNANYTLNECQVYNQEVNDYYDSIIMYYFIGIYIILILLLIAIFIMFYRVTESIKVYFKLLNLLDQEDYTHSAQNCEQLLSIVQYDRIILRLNDFSTILNQPINTFEELKKNTIKATVSVKRSRKAEDIEFQKRQAQNLAYPMLLILLSLSQILYGLSFQLFYNNLQQNISPINNRAIQAQQMRLNFIVSANRFDLYLVKSYFQAYNNSTDSVYFTKNIQTDTMILDLLDISTSIIQEDVYRIQQINFAELLLQDSSNFQLSQEQQQQILGGDVCNLTGCNMTKDLLSNKLYQEYFSPLFSEGIVSLHQTMLSFIQGSEVLVQNDEDLVTTLENILDDPIYIIYFLWGIDVIQYQISEFSQYFIDCSLQILLTLTQYNQISIILIGTGLIVFIMVFQILFVILQFRKYQLSKQIIKFIPLTVLFQKNIPKHLANFQRKNMH